MRISLFQKLFVTVLTSSVLVISAMALFVNASFKDGFQQYLNQQELAKVEELAASAAVYYSERYRWLRLEQSPHLWANLIRQLGELPPPPEAHRQKHPVNSNKRASESLFSPLSTRVNLLSLQGRSLLGPPENLLSSSLTSKRVAIEVKGEVVGYISVFQSESLTDALSLQFLQSQSKHLLEFSIATIVLSLLFALLSARYFARPLRALHKGALEVGEGNLDYQIDHKGNDEVADVTAAFNDLVTSLKQQQQLREQWLSDISHELRTPLAVLRGELEALQDGIRKPEPAFIDSLHQQVLTLTQLVEDLRSTTNTDMATKLTKETVDISALVTNVAESHKQRFASNGLVLTCHANTPVMLALDKQKITQVLNNLLENSYRYTDSNGEVRVAIEKQGSHCSLTIEDSAPSVPDKALSKLFDRLYRVDQSRSRAFGGSGLGLSICQNIVQAHRGTISVQHSQLGGLRVEIQLPISD